MKNIGGGSVLPRRKPPFGSVNFLGVDLHVGPEVGPVSELLTALRTSKGLLAGMGPHVSLQQPWPGKAFATDVTLVREAVGQHVHRQRW